MSATGLDVFDKTLQTTNIWLDEIIATLGSDRQVAWKVLSVVLHKLRDRMPVELSAHLSAELPLLVRGVYYDQFAPAKQPTDWELEHPRSVRMAVGYPSGQPAGCCSGSVLSSLPPYSARSDRRGAGGPAARFARV